MERPIVLDATLSLLNSYPFADALQVFESDAASGAFGLRDQPLTDGVVDVAGEPLLLPPALLEESLGRLGAFGLEPRPKLRVTFAQAIQVPAGESLAVRVGGDVDDAEVNPEPVARRVGGWFGYVHDHGEVESAVAVDEVSLPADAIQPESLIPAEDDGDKLPPLERQDGHAVKPLPGKYPLIVNDGPMRTEDRLLGTVPLIGFRGLADGADGHLGRESKPLPDVAVNELLEPDLVSRPLAEGDLGNGVAGGVEPLHRLQERGGLLGRRLEFNRQRQIHGYIIAQKQQCTKGGSRPSSPRLKAGASGRRFWW